MIGLKILFVSRSFPFHRLGGMESIAWDLARGLKDMGAHVTVLTTACQGRGASFVEDDIPVHTVNSRPGNYSPAWWKLSEEWFGRYAVDQFDIVFSVSIAALSIVKAYRAPDRRARYVMQSHGTAWTDFRSKIRAGSMKELAKALYMLPAFVKDIQYRKFDAIVGVGPAITRDFSHFPMRAIAGETPVFRVNNGIDTNHFRFRAFERDAIRESLAIGPDEPTVLMVGRLHLQKGMQHGLRAFALARRRNPDLKMIIAGEGPHEDALRVIVSTLHLGDSVKFLGRISRQMLPQIYSAADMLLFTTTRMEGLALVSAEALSCGLPVVASRHVILPDQPRQIAVNPHDAEAIADHILQLAGEQRNEASKLNPNYSQNQMVSSYYELLSALSGGEIVSRWMDSVNNRAASI